MEFIEETQRRASRGAAGPLTPALALEVGLQVARALAAAEHRGLVHRDLKPSNIMLAAEGEKLPQRELLPDASEAWVKVIDFGLAKLRDKAEQTATGFFGTAAFASPEQIKSARSTRSFGYLLVGRNPLVLPDRKKSLFPAARPRDPRDLAKSAPLPVAQLAERGIPRVCHRAP